MIEATKKLIKDWKDFSGKMSRSDFWWAYLGTFLIYLAVGFVFGLFFGLALGFEDSIILWILAGLTCIPATAIYVFLTIATISAEIRRLRDAGFPWWAIFVNFVPSVGQIAFIVFLCLPTTDKQILDNFKSSEPAQQPAPTANQASAPIVDVAPEEAPVVAANDWYCPQCGAQNSANFCASCGTKRP